MCNLYSMTRNQEAIRRLFKAERDHAGNLPSLLAIFPDYLAPIVRIGGGERQLEKMRWECRVRPNTARSPSPIFAT